MEPKTTKQHNQSLGVGGIIVYSANEKPPVIKMSDNWRCVKWNLPKEVRDNLWRELARLGALHGCPIAAEPTNDATGASQPNLIAILEYLTNILRESPDDALL